MNPFRWSFRAQFLLGFVACAALLGFAFFSQYSGGLEPCPLCIFQRIAFAALGLVFLLGGLHAPRGAGGRRAYGVLALVAAGVGIGRRRPPCLAAALPPDQVPACGPGLAYMMEAMPARRRGPQGADRLGRMREGRLDLPRPVDAGMEPALVRAAGVGPVALSAFRRR